MNRTFALAAALCLLAAPSFAQKVTVDWDKDYGRVKHRPPPDYVEAEADRKVVIEWYDLEDGLEVAGRFRMPLLVVFSNPPDG